jgi:hypothetical protein
MIPELDIVTFFINRRWINAAFIRESMPHLQFVRRDPASSYQNQPAK